MKSVFKTILNAIKPYVKDLIYTIIIILLICGLSTAVNKCSSNRAEYKNNIIALNDTIHYYKGKNGNLVATIRGFETDMKTLKLLNSDLYKRIDDLKAKGKVTTATYFTGVIENPKNDTTYVVLHDTIENGFRKDFAFNNEYRILEGNVTYRPDTVGVNIEKDQVMFDYTVAMDDKNNIMIHSDNPYVKFTEITGFQLPKPKAKHWSINAFSNFAYNPSHSDRYFDAGIFGGYTIKKFSIGPTVFYRHNFLTRDKSIYVGASMNFRMFEW